MTADTGRLPNLKVKDKLVPTSAVVDGLANGYDYSFEGLI
jgi:hypothetical protein